MVAEGHHTCWAGLSSLPEVIGTFPVLYFAPGNKVYRNKNKNLQRNRTIQIPGSGDKEGRMKAEDSVGA